MGPELLEALRKIAARFNIQKVVLFGSRARDEHDDRSDIDLAVYADEDISEFVYELDNELPTLLELDVTRITGGLDPVFVEQIDKEGIVVYEKH